MPLKSLFGLFMLGGLSRCHNSSLERTRLLFLAWKCLEGFISSLILVQQNGSIGICLSCFIETFYGQHLILIMKRRIFSKIFCRSIYGRSRNLLRTFFNVGSLIRTRFLSTNIIIGILFGKPSLILGRIKNWLPSSLFFRHWKSQERGSYGDQ